MANPIMTTPLIPILIFSGVVLVACSSSLVTEAPTNDKASVVISQKDKDTKVSVRTLSGETTLENGVVSKIIGVSDKNVLTVKVKEAFNSKLDNKVLRIQGANQDDSYPEGDTFIFDLVDGEIINDELSMKQIKVIKGIGDLEEVKAKVMSIDEKSIRIKTVEDSEDNMFPENYEIIINYEGGDPTFDSLQNGKVYEFEIAKTAPMTRSMPPQINWEYVSVDK